MGEEISWGSRGDVGWENYLKKHLWTQKRGFVWFVQEGGGKGRPWEPGEGTCIANQSAKQKKTKVHQWVTHRAGRLAENPDPESCICNKRVSQFCPEAGRGEAKVMEDVERRTILATICKRESLEKRLLKEGRALY